MTHDDLADLLADVPVHVTAEPGAAWAAGRRRRARARVGAAGAAVVVCALLAGVLGLLPTRYDVQPAGDDSGVGVDGYPQRIEKAWRIGDLPAAPGPLAGLLETPEGWLAVDSTGHQWRLPRQDDVSPSLSADGTRLVLLVDGVLTVENLLDGRRTPYLDGDQLRSQHLAFFSPDGARVLVTGRDGKPRILEPDATVTAPREPPGAGYVAGWAGPDRIAYYGYVPDRDRYRGVVQIADLDGAVVDEWPIDLPDSGDLNQWSASTSPDGFLLAIRREQDDGYGSVETIDLTNGDPIARGRIRGFTSACPVAWRDGTGVATASTFGGGTLHSRVALLRLPTDIGDTGGDVVVADPRFEVVCSAWASDALDGVEHRGIAGRLFGTSDLRLWWYWREALAALVLLAGLVVVRRRLRTYRAADAHSSRSSP